MFKQAERKNIKLKVALVGPEGTGKTLSALKLAFGLVSKGGKVAVTDSENGRAALYSDRYKFGTDTLTAPFTTEKYIQSINDAVKQDIEVLIIDSMTHAWAGPGGLLAQKNLIDQAGGNSYTNWKKPTEKQNAFMSAILQAPIHIICTMRAKADIVIETNSKGKKVPVKKGMGAIQREGVGYEFMVMWDLDQEHIATATKDNTGVFDGKPETLSEDSGKKLQAWLVGAPTKQKLHNHAPGAVN